MHLRSLLSGLWAFRDILIVVLAPTFLSPLLFTTDGKESSCAYVIIIMAIFWVTEALPINVTALLPVFMFPMVGVMSANDVAGAFFKSTSLMFTGGMMVAVAIERWDIHRRIALRILLMLGSKPSWLMLGLMLTSWFLSMWISNTATTAMMLPIATAMVSELRNMKEKDDERHDVKIELNKLEDSYDHNQIKDIENGAFSSQSKGKHMELEVDANHNSMDDTDQVWTRLNKVFCLCIAYSANIGGTGSVTGTVPNLVLIGQIDDIYAKLGKEPPLTFASWMMFGVPTSLLIVLASWCWLQVYYLGIRGVYQCCKSEQVGDNSRIKRVLREQYQNLGPFSFGQVSVLIHFAILVLLWITRDLGGSYGWANLFKDKFVKDSVPAILIGVSLFIFPGSLPRFEQCDSNGEIAIKLKRVQPLLSWNDFTTKMPWGVIFLLGGGFTMAKAAAVSGLSAWLGIKLEGLSGLDPWLLCLCLCFIVAAATEVTSNTATTSLILPILADLSIKLGLEPIYLMLPVTIAASFAFMLPVATPPNAVIFSSGYVRVFDMVKAGFLLNIIGVCILVASMESLGRAIYL